MSLTNLSQVEPVRAAGGSGRERSECVRSGQSYIGEQSSCWCSVLPVIYGRHGPRDRRRRGHTKRVERDTTGRDVRVSARAHDFERDLSGTESRRADLADRSDRIGSDRIGSDLRFAQTAAAAEICRSVPRPSVRLSVCPLGAPDSNYGLKFGSFEQSAPRDSSLRADRLLV